MISRRFKKFISYQQRRKFLQLFQQKFSNKEYVLFLRKFRGSMLSKGKSSCSYKLFDFIRIFFKKLAQKNDIDPDKLLKRGFSKLIPVLGTSNVRRGRRVETIPVLLKLRKRI